MKRAFLLILIFMLFVNFAPQHWITWSYPYAPLAAASILRGQTKAEIFQDIIGFQMMAAGENPYVTLDATISTPTTHPPTSFLLAAPVSFLPLMPAIAVWGWLMVAATGISLRLLGYSWPAAIPITVLSILWMPTAGSWGQLTPVWLLGCALAYHFRNHNAFASGAFIAFASLTKYLPAVLLLPFLLKKKWSALAGFALVWAVSLVILFAIAPDVIRQYIEANLTASPHHIARWDNNALLPFAHQNFGFLGVGLTVGLLVMVLIVWWKEFQQEEISPAAWHVTSFLAVALLPITWFYSIFPLLPTFLWLSSSRKAARIPGLLSILLPPYIPFINLILMGVGLILQARPDEDAIRTAWFKQRPV